MRGNWTDERIELLKKLYAEGLSGSQIAAELGGLTRNAVIGKIHRLELTGRVRVPSSSEPRKRKPRDKFVFKLPASTEATPAQQARAEKQYQDAAEATDLPADVSPKSCTLLDLNEDTCRWPLGDPSTFGFRFCGAVPLASLPYCLRHSAIAYAAPNERRKKSTFKDAA